MKSVDLFVIGGGINGAGIARDAAGRGLSVMLAEKGDYASATSSASSKLVHGGLRYLENYEFGLVRRALHERACLLKVAPHLVEPQRFLIPIAAGRSRPAWLLRLGLFVYDLFAGRDVPKTRRIPVREALGKPRLGRAGISGLLSYFDARTDDARLVLATLLGARDKGADIGNYREVTKITSVKNGYQISYKEAGVTHDICARFVVNAAGPWANRILDLCQGCALPRKGLRLVRGSHILLEMPVEEDHDAYVLQNTDGRIVFVIPWSIAGRHFLVLGTTDMPQDAPPEQVTCSDEERDYLLACYNLYFTHHGDAYGAGAGPDDVVWAWAGVRPLVDDGAKNPSKVSREVDFTVAAQGNGGFITVYGGKLTTYRHLAEQVMDKLKVLGADIGPSWTENTPLLGGDLQPDALEKLAYTGPGVVPIETKLRWAEAYGSQISLLFEKIMGPTGPGQEIAHGVFEIELYYAAEIEDAKTGDDFLYRRSKLGIVLTDSEKDAVRSWFETTAKTL